MKILVVTSTSNLSGGANRSLLMVLTRLKNEYSHEITVVVPDNGEIINRLKQLEIKTVVYGFHHYCGVRKMDLRGIARLGKYNLLALADRITACRIAGNLRNEHFDMVYINDVTANIGAMVAHKLGIPYVWHFRSFVGSDDRYFLGAEKIFKKCSAIITISSFMENLLKKNKYFAGANIVMISNGKAFENSIPSEQNMNKGLHLVHCGRIAPEKCQYDSIMAVARLKGSGYRDIFLHIAGQDLSYGKNGYKSALDDLIEKYCLQDQVIFEGLVDNMPEFRRKMNVELMCSANEPFGLVTVEGMRSGLIVIGADSGGTIDIIKDGYNGLLYKTGDYEELAEKIKYVHEHFDEAVKLAQNALAFSADHFTPEENASKINKVLEASL